MLAKKIGLLGAILVFFAFPKRDEEMRLLAAYLEEDSRGGSSGVGDAPAAVGRLAPADP